MLQVPTAAIEIDSPSTSTGGWIGSLRQNPLLPPEGGRLELVFGDRHLGWLDLWGDGRPADTQSRRGLHDLIRVVSLVWAGANPDDVR